MPTNVPPPPRTPSRRKQHRVLPAAAACLAVLLTSACNSTTPTGDAEPVAATTAATGSSGAQMAGWSRGGGSTHLTDIQADTVAVAQAAMDGNDTAMSDACQSMRIHVDAAQAYAPIPDPQAQQHWAAALRLYGKSATDCIQGAAGDPAAMKRSTDEVLQGTEEIKAAAARVGEIADAG